MRRPLFASLVAATLLVLAGPAMADEEKVVNVYNWSDYIAPDTLEKFTAATGIKVNYDVYDSNETLSAKLQAGDSGYDVVFPSSSPFLAQQVKANIYSTLDRSKIKNWSTLDPAVMKTLETSDPGNAHAVPYMIAATGIGFNIDKVKQLLGPDAKLDSWSLLFDPAVVSKLQSCGVSLLDTPTEVFPAALTYIGRNGASQSMDDLNAAVAVVTKIRPSVKYFHSSKYINDLANGDTCLAHGYVGDLVQARNRANEAGKGVHIGIIIPKEGAVLGVDVAAIPADAPHPDNAHRFIDFLLRPEIIAAITNTVGYANAVLPARPLVKKDILNDPVIYPPEAIRAKEFQVPPADPNYERARTRAWTRVKTGH
jgi:putrescine transport system substrate-binding protein